MQEPTKYDSVFWIEIEKIHPNPYQPRRDFNKERLSALAESIRQYGVLQPLVVTRVEHTKPDGGISSEYELLAGERRLRASELIGLNSVPAVIRNGKESARAKLEIAIIENLQREDLNAIDRAKALSQLADEFGISHTEVAVKIGRSREYVSNSIRLLNLPEEIQKGVVDKEITEGHARALLMLSKRPQERDTLFRDIMLRKTSVRVTEQLARRIATDRVRKHDKTPEMLELEKTLTEKLGTRVVIEKRPNGGRLLIEFFSPDDLSHIATLFADADESLQNTEAARSDVAVSAPSSDSAMVASLEGADDVTLPRVTYPTFPPEQSEQSSQDTLDEEDIESDTVLSEQYTSDNEDALDAVTQADTDTDADIDASPIQGISLSTVEVTAEIPVVQTVSVNSPSPEPVQQWKKMPSQTQSPEQVSQIHPEQTQPPQPTQSAVGAPRQAEPAEATQPQPQPQPQAPSHAPPKENNQEDDLYSIRDFTI